MTFIDPLTLVLDLLILVTAAVFYTGFFAWMHTRRKDPERALSHVKEGAGLLGILGGIVLVIALWGEMTWPIPPEFGGYNLFFFDPLVLLSVLLLGFALAVWYRLPTHFVGMLGVVVGIGVMFYGVRGYLVPLTEAPLETLLMYLAFGAAAVLSYPATLFLDWFVIGPAVPGVQPLPSQPVPDYPRMWTILLVLFMLAVVLAGAASVAYGITAAWAHLASPP